LEAAILERKRKSSRCNQS